MVDRIFPLVVLALLILSPAVVFAQIDAADGQNCIANDITETAIIKEDYEAGLLFSMSIDLGDADYDAHNYECNADYAFNSCCAANYTSKIYQGDDAISEQFEHKMRRWSKNHECRDMIRALSCSMCHPMQAMWMDATPGFLVLDLCPDFCLEIFLACEDVEWREHTECESLITDEEDTDDGDDDDDATDGDAGGDTQCTVGRRFTGTSDLSRGVAFCYNIFSGDIEVNVRDDDCFNNREDCTREDLHVEFTECDELNQRTIYYTWNEGSQCVKNDAIIPAPKNGVMCNKTCEEGFHVAFEDEEISCKQCSPGTFSLGGGYRIDDWSLIRKLYNENTNMETWEYNDYIRFQSYCEYKTMMSGNLVRYRSEKCGWEQPAGEFLINSGNRTNDDNLNSVLELDLVIVSGSGSVSFGFEVEGDPCCDGLIFYVDDQVVMERETNVQSLTIRKYDLSPGYHTLKWKYEKDFIISAGRDMAHLAFIEVVGVIEGNNECDKCGPGEYQDQPGKSFCLRCGENQYQDKEGEASCKPCDDEQFAYGGASECSPRLPCTEDDWTYSYTRCQPNTGNRTQVFSWVDEPRFCSLTAEGAKQLPSSQSVRCPPCDPGEYRVGATCVYCSPGSYTSEPDSSTCQICSPGEEAIQSITVAHWEPNLEDGYYFNSSCSGRCGSPHWRMRESFIDSGSGHGDFIETNLYFHTRITATSMVAVNFSVTCPSAYCRFKISSNGNGYSWMNPFYQLGSDFGRESLGPMQVNMEVPTDGPLDLEVLFSFHKEDAYLVKGDDNVRIYSMSATNTHRGGAVACTPCERGTFSEYPSDSCKPADIGFYVPEVGSTEQIACDGNSFTDARGMFQCKPCGGGMESNEDRDGCQDSCQWIPPNQDDTEQGKLISFDVSRLSRSSMYPPVLEDVGRQLPHRYYLNVCSKEHDDESCVDINGVPVEAFACQVTTGDFGVSIGNQMGYRPLDGNNLQMGFWMDYLYGESRECPSETPGGPSKQRSSHIEFICDPSAGVGVPEPYFDDNIVEMEACEYRFQWRSLYACPVCNSLHWTHTYTECQPDGVRYAVYQWIDNPKKCHSGDSLPPSTPQPCGSTPSAALPQCSDGFYAEPTTGDCAVDHAGYYTIQTGRNFDYWPSNWLEQYAPTFVTDGWEASVDGKSLRNQNEGNSFIVIFRNFTQAGSFSARFKVYADNDDEESGLQFFLDERPQGSLIHDTEFKISKIRFDVPAGPHSIKVAFRGASTPGPLSQLVGVRLTEVQLRGIQTTSIEEIPCPPGSTSNSANSGCTACHGTSFSDGGSTCERCGDDSESWIQFDGGAEHCLDSNSHCSSEDVDSYAFSYYTPCSGGYRYKKYEFIRPKVCKGASLPSPVRESCGECRPGYWRVDDQAQCQKCESGSWHDEVSNECKTVDPGTFARQVIGFFYDVEEEGSLDKKRGQEEDAMQRFPDLSNFTTGCTGTCGLDGWRVRGNYMDSGPHRHYEVDSWLRMDVVQENNRGSISFEYRVIRSLDDTSSGLRFYVDGVGRDIPYQSPVNEDGQEADFMWQLVTEPLTEGHHKLRWGFHQAPRPYDNSWSREMKYSNAHAEMRRITVTGSTLGGATSIEECQPGYFSDSAASACTPCPPGSSTNGVSGSSSCTPCRGNRFAEFPGSASCIACGTNTTVNEAKTDCVTNCIFADPIDGRRFDLRPLDDLRSGPYPLQRTGGHLVLNVCAKGTSEWCLHDDINDHKVPINTFSCWVRGNEKDSVDFGRVLGAQILSEHDDDGGTVSAVQITYSHGVAPPSVVPELAALGCSEPKTIVVLVCDMKADPIKSSPIEETATHSDCEIRLKWRTPYACPLCDEDDYAALTSPECEDGIRKVSLERISECYGPAVLEQSIESCEHEYTLPLALIIVGILAFIVLIVVVIIVVIRNRKIEMAYSLLVNETAKTYEMSNISAPSASQSDAEMGNAVETKSVEVSVDLDESK